MKKKGNIQEEDSVKCIFGIIIFEKDVAKILENNMELYFPKDTAEQMCENIITTNRKYMYSERYAYDIGDYIIPELYKGQII